MRVSANCCIVSTGILLFSLIDIVYAMYWVYSFYGHNITERIYILFPFLSLKFSKMKCKNVRNIPHLYEQNTHSYLYLPVGEYLIATNAIILVCDVSLVSFAICYNAAPV